MLPRTILVPIDFSPGSERALDHACALAEKLGATVHLVNATGVPLPEMGMALSDQMLGSLREDNRAGLDKLVAARGPIARSGRIIVVGGEARDAILTIAEELHADLIVMGTHGRRGLSRLVLGSVAEAVVRSAPCPVLTVREPAT